MSLRGRESTTKTSLNSADVDPSALLADSDPERDPDAGDEELTEEGAKKGEDKDAQDRALLTTVGLMMVFGLTNNIFRVLQYQPMQPYALFINLLTTFIYLPTSWVYVWIRWDKLSPEEKMIPWWKWAVMGFLDGISGIMQSLATAFVSNGTLVILLMQSAIPSSMVISRLLLGKRYKAHNYLGALGVGIGIVIVLLPSFTGTQPSSTEKPPPGGIIVWAFVLILSCIPMALSSVYKEMALGDADVDAIHMNGQVAIYQFIFSIILLYPSAFTENLAANQVWQNLADGAKCLVAINPTKSDHCSNAPWLVALYCVANIGYNILIIILLRVGGANLLWLVLTAIVPLGALTFTLPFIPASNRSQINWEIFVGLFVIMAGLVIYRFWDRIAGLFGMGGDKKATSAAAAGAAAGGDASGDKAEGALGLGLDEDGLTVSSQSPSFATTPIRGTNMHIPRRLQQQGGKPARAPAAPAGRRPAPAGGEAPF